MDKYTVDLDKVLNDFEYKELTDQSPGTVTGAPAVARSEPPRTLHYNANLSSAKHSINNVFQTLSEYINTEISPQCENIHEIQTSVLNRTNELPVRITNSSDATADNNSISSSITGFGNQSSRVQVQDSSVSCDNGTPVKPVEKEDQTSVDPKDDNKYVGVDGASAGWSINHNGKTDGSEDSDIKDGCMQTNESTKSSGSNIHDDAANSDNSIETLETEDIRNEQVSNTNLVAINETTWSNTQVANKIDDIHSSEELTDTDSKPSVSSTITDTSETTSNESQIEVIRTTDMSTMTGDTHNIDIGHRETGEGADFGNIPAAGPIIDGEGECCVDNAVRCSDVNKIDVLIKEESVENKDHVEGELVGDSSLIDDKSNRGVESNDDKVIEGEILADKISRNSMHCDNPKTDAASAMCVFEMARDIPEIEKSVPEIQEDLNVLVSIAEGMQKISFDDSIVNLNDAELNKYLEELEEEYESQFKNLEAEAVDKKPAPRQGGPHLESCNPEKTNEVNTQVKIDEVENKLPKDVEAISKVTVTNVQINVIDLKQEDVSEGDEILEVTVEKVPVQIPIVGNTGEDTVAISRPSNLELGRSLSDESKRQIDLIGEPGSTPYNNVYIAKELPATEPSKPPDIDSENSSCTSPTFSNASTDTVSSSTDSAELPPDNPQPNPSSTVSSAAVPGDMAASVAGAVNAAEAAAAQDTGRGDQVEASGEVRRRQEYDGSPNIENPAAATAPVDGVEGGAFGNVGYTWLGKHAPVWIPDSDALNCMHCDMKFTVIKRRHHCRACGLVLCSKCCGLKYRLEYLDSEARVCTKCHDILKAAATCQQAEIPAEQGAAVAASAAAQRRQLPPNPNNPLEYCSTVPPLQQTQGASSPPAVLVPVGVLKRKGSNKMRSNKSVMFCDGIRPGSDLTNLDNDFNYTDSKSSRKTEKLPAVTTAAGNKANKNIPPWDVETRSLIPTHEENLLPPIATFQKTEVLYAECVNTPSLMETMRTEIVTFAVQTNLFVHVKIINTDCPITKTAWCFSTEGMISVGQDEIVIVLELLDDETLVPKDVFLHLNNIYNDAIKGNSVKELGLSLHHTSNFLGSKNHAGFVYIRRTVQCLDNVIIPKEPFLIGILIHRWETPWAKLFPLRLVMRLGAEYRYYPCPIISTRFRDSVYVEIGHTVISVLADFRNYVYSLPQIRGLTILMVDKVTNVNIPVNRYDQVMKALNNSSDHMLAFAGNFSTEADSHLVCLQDTHSNDNSYSTSAINVHGDKGTARGASFIVFNGSLKSSSGLTAKSQIVEDGLMVHVMPEHLQQVRDSLRNMKNHTIRCGYVDAPCGETIQINWTEADANFNIGVLSPIDGQPLSGVPSIRVHNGRDFISGHGNRLIRWTEVFILQNAEESSRNQDPVDISKVSEGIARATCTALVKYLDLLVSNNFYKIAIRTTLHVENVSYLAGSNSVKLPPIYMKSLDNELIPVLHRITSNNFGENIVVLELVFRILNV